MLLLSLHASRRLCCVVAVLSLSCLSCAGSQPPARSPASGDAVSAPTPELPEIPDNPLLLVPGDATELAVANLERLRESAHFPMLRNWAVRFGCLQTAQEAELSHWLLDRTQLLVAASFPADAKLGARNRGVLIVRGELPPDTPQRALGRAAALTRRPATEGEQTHKRGRFEVSAHAGLSATRLSDELLVIGDSDAVETVLALADGTATHRFVDSALYKTHEEALGDHALALLAVPSDSYREELSSQLASVGAKSLLSGLQRGSLLATADLDDDVQLRVQARYESEAAAQAAEKAAHQLYFQGNLLLRLTGMPRIFERAEAQADGLDVRYQLSASEQEITRLRDRVEWLLEAAAEGGCKEGR